MKTFQIILILTIGLFTIGCDDVIYVDLDTAQPKLVIDASIDWVKNTTGNEQKIKLSTSTGYYNTQFPTVSGATIFITNSASTVFNFTEIPNTGEYVCNDFVPIIDETYTLTVTLNGEIYTAVETLIGTPVIENTINQNNSGGPNGDEIEIEFFYQDNGLQENYYANSVKTNYTTFPQYSINSDEFFQGNQIVQLYSHEDLKADDILSIKLFGISKRYYNYFSKILKASGNEGGPEGSTPLNVSGNIINQTNSADYALGFFRLSEVDTMSYVVQ